MPKRAQQQRSKETRQAILQAALEEFSKHDYEVVSLRVIADAVGVNHAMVRYYFGGKEALWREAVTFLFGRLLHEMTPAPETATARERFEHTVRTYVRYCARHPEHARFMIQESNRDSSRMRWIVESFVKPVHDRLLPVITELVADGTLPSTDPVLALYLMSALAQAPYLLMAEMRHAYGADALADDAVAAHAEAVAKFIFKS